MKLRSEVTNNLLVIHLAGSIRAHDNHALEAFAADIEVADYRGVIFELSGLEYLNSRAIGTVMALWKAATASKVRVAATSPRPLVARLLAAVGLYRLLPCYPDVQAALRALRE